MVVRRVKRVGLIGYPLQHSISPLFQQAAFDHLGLELRYEIWEIEPERLAAEIEGMRRPPILGANVTTPYKQAVLPLLDEVDELASQIGAVNTIVNRDGRLGGYNTDVLGFLKALGEFEPKGKRVIIFGAGGVARAVSFALIKVGVKSLIIINRTLERAEGLVGGLKREAEPNIELAALPWEGGKLKQALSHCDLLINCTLLGMRYSSTSDRSPLQRDLIPKEALVYDLVYNPIETPLLREAKKAGARTLEGLPMLIYQGAASFELWTGKKAPVGIMFKAARGALKS
jgi:shikimate dehydrogenase